MPIGQYDASRTHAAAQLQQMISRTVRVTVNHVRHVLLLHRRADRRLVDVHDRRGFVALFGAALVEIGRASCRERVCQYVYISVVAVSLKKKQKDITK